MPDNSVDPSVKRLNESVACDICGHFGAIEFGDRLICPDCYGQNCGSCCPEFGKEEPDQGETT
jgi:hypothetical protein